MKDFVVIGLGNFGATVARELMEQKCKVTAIDIDESKVYVLKDVVDTEIVGNAVETEFLKKLGIENYDCFVISTGKDSHASILITLHLKEMGAKRIIVKANSNDHAKILSKVGANEVTIPEEQMAIRLSRSLANPNLIDYIPLLDEYSVVEVPVPEDFIALKLADLKLRSKYNLQVIAVQNEGEDSFTFIPDGEYTFRKNDILIVVGKEEEINKMKS